MLNMLGGSGMSQYKNLLDINGIGTISGEYDEYDNRYNYSVSRTYTIPDYEKYNELIIGVRIGYGGTVILGNSVSHSEYNGYIGELFQVTKFNDGYNQVFRYHFNGESSGYVSLISYLYGSRYNYPLTRVSESLDKIKISFSKNSAFSTMDTTEQVQLYVYGR